MTIFGGRSATHLFSKVPFLLLVNAVLSDPRVQPPCGPLVGTYIQARGGRNISAFLGIPFGKPPVDNLRFEVKTLSYTRT